MRLSVVLEKYAANLILNFVGLGMLLIKKKKWKTNQILDNSLKIPLRAVLALQTFKSQHSNILNPWLKFVIAGILT